MGSDPDATATWSPRPGPLAGKVALVTGATSGIGAVGARQLAERGATVVVVGRDPHRTRAAADAIRARTGNPSVLDLSADLSRISEVRRLATEVSRRYPHLDLLVNDAGAIFAQRLTTPEGHERTWALNVLAPFLLMRLLEERLASAPSARVVNVSSMAHRWGHLDLEDPGRSRSYSAWGAYGQSKLALLLLTYAAARRLARSRVTVNALHPGFVATRFGHDNPGYFRWGVRIAAGLFGISAERGARTLVYLATSLEVEGVTGRYFARGRETRSSPASYDVALGEALWARCLAETEAPAPS